MTRWSFETRDAHYVDGEVFDLDGLAVTRSFVRAPVDAKGPHALQFPKTRRFATPALAAKYVRCLAEACLGRGLMQVEGPALALDASESFVDVRDRSELARYFEHDALGVFVDLELDGPDLLDTRGERGTRGTTNVVTFEWDGAAEKAYEALVETLDREGYVEREPSVGPRPALPEVLATLRAAPGAHHGKRLANPPTYVEGTRLIVEFELARALSRASACGFEADAHPGFVLLAGLGEEPGVLVVDTRDAACPVWLFLSSEGLYAVSPSLRALLESLEPAPVHVATKKAPTKKAPTKKAPTKKAPTKKAPTKKAPTKKA